MIDDEDEDEDDDESDTTETMYDEPRNTQSSFWYDYESGMTKWD